MLTRVRRPAERERCGAFSDAYLEGDEEVSGNLILAVICKSLMRWLTCGKQAVIANRIEHGDDSFRLLEVPSGGIIW